MAGLKTSIKSWLPAIGAMLTVVAAVVYAISRTTTVSDEIRNMDDLAASLSSKAMDVEAGVRSNEEVERLQSQRVEFESRMSDSEKPGLVVSQLSQAARASGLQVLEIQPMTPSLAGKISSADPNALVLPNYRVSLKGDYKQIAAYMTGCATQRIPVRVVGIEMGRMEESDSSPGEDLRADITVEAYQPRRKMDESTQGA